MIRLRHLAEINPATPQFDRIPDDKELPFAPLEAVWPGGVDLSRSKLKSEASTGYTRFLEGDILVPKITPTFEANRSTIASDVPGGVAAGTTELHVVRVGEGADVRFIRYLLSSKYFLSFGEASMVGVAGQKRIPDQLLRDLPVQITDLAEQRAIADYLDRETARIDALIAAKRRMIDLSRDRYAALRRSTILGGLNPISGQPAAPEWPNVRLGILIELHRGFDLPAEARSEGHVPVISSGGVSGWHDAAMCDAPGVVTGRYGSVGSVFYADRPYWPLNTTLFVSQFRGCHPRWVYHLLQSLPLDFDAEKSAVTGINRNVIGQLIVPRPSATEQRCLSERLDDAERHADSLVRVLQAQIDLLNQRRQAVIPAAVMGELSIPEAVA